MKKHITNIILVLFLLIGLGLLMYPFISDYWNTLHQSKAIATYVDEIKNIDENKYEEIINEARNYNDELLRKKTRWNLTIEDQQEYNIILKISSTGVMGYIEIPQINVSLPIYHTVSDEVLQVAIGHIPGTSFPIGGKGTHCVLSGHRGLPSAKLFTDLDKLIVGDIFMIRVLDETLTYEIDQILIVDPTDISSLEIDVEKDYCTLVTCTPYGVNTHRLLVRGHRIENLEVEKEIKIVAEAMQIDPVIIAPILATPILLVLLFILLFKKKK